MNSDSFMKWVSPKYLSMVNALLERESVSWLAYRQFNNIMNKKSDEKPEIKTEAEPENAASA